MNRFKHLLLSCLSASAVLAGAGAARADNWTDYMTVTEVVTFGDEYAIFTSGVTNNGTNNPGSCSSTGVYYFNTAQTTAAGRETMVKTLLAAFLAGKKVSVWVENNAGSNACATHAVGVTAPSFYRVSLVSNQ